MNHREIDSIKRAVNKYVDNYIEKAFKEGFEQGSSTAHYIAYEKGLDDAWECAKKIDTDRDFENYVFGEDLEHSFDNISASEAIEKLAKWKKENQMSKFESTSTLVNPTASQDDEDDKWLDEMVANIKDKKLKLSSVDPEEYEEYIKEVSQVESEGKG